MDEERFAGLVAEQIESLERRIDGRFQNMEQRFEQMEQRIIDSSANLAKLITDVSDSLQKELRDLHQHRTRMDDRLNRHGGELISGARWIARLTEWTQATDQNMILRDERLADLEARIRKLESDRPAA